MPHDNEFRADPENGMYGTTPDGNLPLAPERTDAEDEDGIFMSWPGSDPDDVFPDDTDDRDAEEEGLTVHGFFEEEDGEDDTPHKKKKPKKQKKKKKKSGGKDTDDDAHATYAFRRAADSDLEESLGKPRHSRTGQDESDNESTLSSIKYYKHTAKLKELFLRRLLPVILILGFLFGFVLYFFRLQHLYFVNLNGYDAEDIFRAIDVRKNQFIFTISDSAIEKRLRAQFPYIEDVEVELALPDTVNLIFTEDSALFYTQMYDEYFVISESMRVLARCDTEEELEPGLRRITLPPVSYAVVGHELRFFDVSYLPFLTSFLDVIETSDIYRHISAMDLSNRFDIVLSYDDRLEIELGDNENLETRLLFIKSTIEALEPDDRGVIHIVDNKQAIFSPESRESK